MAVFRIERTRDYTVMSNHHLRDKALSLKSKGLLSMMPCSSDCGFCVRYLLFRRGFRHRNVNADSRSGNQSRI